MGVVRGMDAHLRDVPMPLLIEDDVRLDQPIEVLREPFYFLTGVLLESVGQVTVATAERDLH
jgi:hypothetical protein